MLTRNFTPTFAVLELSPCPLPPADSILGLGALETLLFSFGQALATNYYEQNVSLLKAKFSSDAQLWPDVWNFGRIVRNAMSHAGKIHFDNPKATPVRWRGLEYSPADNGHQILHTDLWPGDIFNLIIEMDSCI